MYGTKAPFRLLVIAAAVVVLASCYLPARFDAEIEIDAAGFYSLKFDGYLADVSLYQKLKQGELTPEQEVERIAVVERDMARDSAASDFEYFKEGHFRIKWERSGDLLTAKTVTFLRRNESMISLKYVANTGMIEMMGRSLGKKDRQRLYDAGLAMSGEIRLKSPLPPVDHNATKVIDDKNDKTQKWYVWRIANIFQETPRLRLRIE